ncbi:MBL fold metallo-hydrolase [Aestuariivirga litoralis]|uniref:MBL fold metallo-hydrolase n=2 Tax=Aestuariivirga litoralis TaxID=2650924 RepID=A0A2W2AQD1_9HYPH|nr:MBL fold metallo-hydrolase [Aestuariivirga litoralis]
MRVADGPWYELRPAGPGLSHIVERHVAPWMRCNMWLIHGRDTNLLIDTGMGLRPIKPEIAALGEKPVTAVCTHCHFDHIGCAHEFDHRLGHAAEAMDYATPDLVRSCASSWIGAELLTALPHEGYELKNFRLTPAPLTGHLDEGDVLDTGDRVFSVLHLPGHSPGSIALYEKATRTLFSGDVIYDGMLIDNAWHSDAPAYEDSLRRLKELAVEQVHAGHENSFGRERLHELIDCYLAGGQRLGDPAAWVAEQAP